MKIRITLPQFKPITIHGSYSNVNAKCLYLHTKEPFVTRQGEVIGCLHHGTLQRDEHGKWAFPRLVFDKTLVSSGRFELKRSVDEVYEEPAPDAYTQYLAANLEPLLQKFAEASYVRTAEMLALKKIKSAVVTYTDSADYHDWKRKSLVSSMTILVEALLSTNIKR